MIRLTDHFSLAELTFSQTAERRGIPNEPGGAERANLQRLADRLEQVRWACGNRPVIITSGYRCAALNAAIGGAKTSAHLTGRAADIKVVGMSVLEVAVAIERARIQFDQIIHEGTWLHFAIEAACDTPRRQILAATFSGGKATYREIRV